MLDIGVILPFCSPQSSPVIFVQKKDCTTRFCIDYHRLNVVTKKDTYSLRRIDDIFDQLNGTTIFSSFDLALGFWQVSMENMAKEKTAFACRQGLFEFNKMPFGFCNATSTFQWIMDMVFNKLKSQCALVYVDDINNHSRYFEQHLLELQLTFDKLKAVQIKLKSKKCIIRLHRVLFLGHIINKDGNHPDPCKIKAVQYFPIPTFADLLQSFLRLANHYRRFVVQFAEIATPFYSLLRKGVRYLWTRKYLSTFMALKDALYSSQVLVYLQFDIPFFVHTNASRDAIGPILNQIHDG